MGCDGGFTELQVGGYSGKAHYRWWGEPPVGWEELGIIAEEVLQLSGILSRIEEARQKDGS